MSTDQIKKPFKLQLLIYSFVFLWFVLAVFPFFWTMWGSFKVELDFFSLADWKNALSGARTTVVYGTPFTGAGYEGAWIQEEFWRAFRNTGIVCFFTVLTSLTIATLGGYALSRSGFRYSFWLLIIALIFRALPPITLVSGYLLPFYEWNIWGILPTTIIVLVAINQPFTLWMLHSFFQKIPKELDEAAKIDGASEVQTFWLIFIPLATPVLAVVTLLSFIGTFNEFILARLFLVDMESRTIAVGLQQFIGGQYSQNWGPFAAGSIIASIPIVIIFLSLQKYIVNGLTAGSVKG